MEDLRSSSAYHMFGPYKVLGVLGEGGMGTVYRVQDEVLGRTLALKVLHEHIGFDMQARFVSEAQITAQLQHPGIVSVHTMGTLADGRFYYTMREVRGRTLDAILQEEHRQNDRPNIHNLVDILRRACEAVAYAHSRGVIHRDLKPSNIMVGDFGEVQVLDWGLARVLGRLITDAPIRTQRSADPSQATRTGRVAGTPSWMSPEQARGEVDQMGPTSDVFSLGTILWSILTGNIPFQGRSTTAILAELRDGGMPAISPEVGAPAELVAACARAMQPNPEGRYATAAQLARALQDWLEGVHRREQALALVEQAEQHRPRSLKLRTQAANLRAQAQTAMSRLSPHAAETERWAAWALEDRAELLDRDAELEELRYERNLALALQHDAALDEARVRLANLYQSRMAAAEQSNDPLRAARYEELLRYYDRGEHARWLTGLGALTLHTTPPASARLFRFENQNRRMVPVPTDELLITPIENQPIPHGSWMLRLEAPGHQAVDYPIYLQRGEHWDSTAPDEAAPRLLRLPVEGELGPDERLIPAGWCRIGGDPEVADGLSARRVWVESFVMQRFPVTWGDWLIYLNALVEAGQMDAAISAWPRTPEAGSPIAQAADGTFIPGKDDLGRVFVAREPVSMVSWQDACAYADWLARRTGLPWRLPHELEWEKAARGVDGRVWPWGHLFDPSRARCALSEATLGPVIIDHYPVDESPYGIRGMAGNIRDWCINPWRVDVGAKERRLTAITAQVADRYVVRGGSWGSRPHLCRPAARMVGRPDERLRSVGLRFVRSYT